MGKINPRSRICCTSIHLIVFIFTDSSIIIELQNIIHKYYHSIQKEKYRSANLVNKVSYLEMEKAELKSSLEEVKSDRTGLELNQLEMQAEVRNLK